MGSLSSRPEVPSQPQVIYVPQTSGSGNNADTQAASPQNTSAADSSESTVQARSDDLLRRGRGTASTIQTSFRGLLSSADTAQPKKTLLGE